MDESRAERYFLPLAAIMKSAYQLASGRAGAAPLTFMKIDRVLKARRPPPLGHGSRDPKPHAGQSECTDWELDFLQHDITRKGLTPDSGGRNQNGQGLTGIDPLSN